MAATRGRRGSSRVMSEFSSVTTTEDSSDSDGEFEPAKAFHRRISTNKEIKTTVSFQFEFRMREVILVLESGDCTVLYTAAAICHCYISQ